MLGAGLAVVMNVSCAGSAFFPGESGEDALGSEAGLGTQDEGGNSQAPGSGAGTNNGNSPIPSIPDSGSGSGSGNPDSPGTSTPVTPGAPTTPDAPRERPRTPPDFNANGKTAIFSDITKLEATLTINAQARTATVSARMELFIHQQGGGSPVLDVAPTTAQFVTVDGNQRVGLPLVTSPDRTSTMRMVDATLAPGKHVLEFETYALRTGLSNYNQTFNEGIDFTKGFEFLTDHDDLQQRFYSERYFPVGFECNRHPFILTVVIQNPAANQRPEVLANGVKEVSPDGRTFKITYPPHGSTSTWFVHVVDRNQWSIATGEYRSVDGRSIPLTVVAPTAAEANQVIADTRAMLPALEADYGPFPKASLLASVGSPNDPMEYDGAVQTDMDLEEETPEDRSALGHELIHQWFARSARPLDGRSGWVDEGIADWRDSGYPRARAIGTGGRFAQLAFASKHERRTPDSSYEQGSLLLSELDFLLRDRGGMKPVLKAFHAKFKDQLYSTEEFLDFIRASAPDLRAQMDPLFTAKVYAGAAVPQ